MPARWGHAAIAAIALGSLLAAGSAIAQGCGAIVAARYALRDGPDGKPVVALRAGGQVLAMLLDTGAEISVLSASGAMRLGLAVSPDRRRVTGLAGTGEYGAAVLPLVHFAGRDLPRLRLPVMRLDGATGLDGLLGADLLGGFQVVIDLRAGLLTLYRSPCAGPPAGASARQAGGSLPIVQAFLDGRPLPALLDTGASSSAVDRAAAELGAGTLAGDIPGRSFAAGGQGFPVLLHRFGSLRVGRLTLRGVTLRVAPLSPALPMRLLLGIDVLHGRVLWIDYRRHRAALLPDGVTPTR